LLQEEWALSAHSSCSNSQKSFFESLPKAGFQKTILLFPAPLALETTKSVS
jgi:hypothetical protein